MKVLLIALMFLGCNENLVTYKIKDRYVGPCVVFIYENDSKVVLSDNVQINENGLGRITEQISKNKFIFSSLEGGNELKIIEIGKESNVSDSSRYIFRLVKGSSSSNCTKKDLNIITFYVGKKSDFLNWVKQNGDELEYLKLMGLDWCDYYKNGIRGSIPE
jgi:hypothetical protein